MSKRPPPRSIGYYDWESQEWCERPEHPDERRREQNRRRSQALRPAIRYWWEKAERAAFLRVREMRDAGVPYPIAFDVLIRAEGYSDRTRVWVTGGTDFVAINDPDPRMRL